MINIRISIFSLFIFFDLLFMQSCDRIKNPVEYNLLDKGRIYALKDNQVQPWGDLYYSYYDSIDFNQISGCNEIKDIHINKKNNLVICSSENKLYFVGTITNKKIKEIVIPNTENPEPYLGFTTVRLFPCYWSENHVILCNWSVYLVNLKTMILEKTIWDARNSEKLTYTRDVRLSYDNRSLYLMLDLYGYWVEGNIGRIEIRQRLAELDLVNSKINELYNYPREDAPGVKLILNGKNYILSYDINIHKIIRFSQSNGDSIDCFFINESNFFHSPYSLDDYIIVHDFRNGFFYKIDSETKTVELYMKFDFNNSDSHNISAGYNTYQIMEGGDLYACFRLRSSGENFIVNLIQKEVMRRFKSEFYKMYLY